MATKSTRYIRIEINFGDGDLQRNYSLDTDPITGALLVQRRGDASDAALVARCFDDARDAALENLEQRRVARLLAVALGREATADEVALTRIGRGPMDAPDGERADAWLAKQGAA